MTTKLASSNELVFVDDDEMEVMLIRQYLERSQIENKLLAFGSGEELLEHLSAITDAADGHPSLLLIDVRMPSMDGFEVTEAVRRLPNYDELPPIIMFSNSDNPADIARSKEVGADEYVIKPTDGPAYIEFLNSLVPEG
ncbi:Transcriptional regulatory protein AfsQ1 [Pseudobythopirellula maris]|uniref:Transcriptional regulatory protein AfsQ1 n=1 Tax=Pseudobythopirellula maris TaxID=2527991 RepID=A0A5C5ZMW0_9BACT|nr:response regulator [Pseudobythopirellula maris]TWT88812.1 Transcriptional regulatory protein AfsQ1 [Pseudobythopirellula maris]